MTARKAGRGGARKGAGRPATTGNGTRSATLAVPMSPKEKEAIRKAAGISSMAAWAREILLAAVRKKKGRG